ncbi:hypothetical protein DRQ11_08575 [candidate division KSB1 bacterium]|nr:MAG: hypothetical protein DRQ11_08575 [candidate division KSB1 bacterium]
MKGILVSTHRRGSLVGLWVRGENNKKYQITVLDFQPYFYIEDKNGEYRGIYGERLKKIFTDDPSQVRIERAKYPRTWEADIIYTRRFLVDKEIYKGIEFPEGERQVTKDEIKPCADVDIEPLVLFLDIEVLQKEGFPEADKAEQPVISFSFRTNKNGKYFTYILSNDNTEKVIRHGDNIVIYQKTEEDLLCSFSNVIEKIDPDIITGWNIVNFDFLYLKNRFKKLHLKWVDERRFEVFDMLDGYKKIFSQPSYTLKRIAEIEGIEKYENIGTFKDSIGFYETDIEKFVEYNRKDVEYVYKINEKHSLIKYFLELKYLVGLESIENTLISSVLIDTMLLRIAKGRGIALPTKAETKEKEKYEGAYVMAEKAGLYENIAVFDFSSYYPSVILNFGLSPENIDNKREERKQNKDEGMIPELVRRMMIEKKRRSDELKKAQPGSQEYKYLFLKRQVVKDTVNATYGVLAFNKFRLYKPELAAKVTEIARNGIKYLISFVKEKGYKVLLADTDSIFVQIPLEKAEKFCEKLNESINAYFKNQYGIQTNFKLEFEKYLKYLLLTGVKKRYAMRIVYNKGECDYIDAKGFENIRTDQSVFTRELLNELFEMIFHGATKEEIREFISNKLRDFTKAPLTEIGISKGISKPFDKYKANTPHIRGAIYSNTYLGTNFQYGDKVQFLWVKGIEGLPPTNVICFDENTDLSKYNIVVDYEKMKQTTVIGKVEPILNALNIDIGLNTNSKQVKLL